MAGTDNVPIGKGACPCCGSYTAVFKVSSKQLAYVTCNACNFQGFARSDRSDEKLRERIAKPAPIAKDDIKTVAPEPIETAQQAPSVRKNSFMSWG